MPTSEQVRSAVESYIDSFNRKDRDAFLACFAPDAVQVDPYPAPANVGPEAIGAFWDGAAAGAESVDFTTRSLHVTADRAALAFTIVIHAPGGSGVTFEGIDVFEVDDDGRIASITAYWDPAEMKPIS